MGEYLIVGKNVTREISMSITLQSFVSFLLMSMCLILGVEEAAYSNI